MAHLNEAMLVRICDLMGASHTASFAAVCRAVGISESCLYGWRAACERDRKADDKSSPFYILYRGEMMWFTQAAAISRAEHLATGEAEIRSQIISGTPEVVRDGNGRPVYKLNPRFIGRDDLWVMLDTDCEASDVAWHRLAHDADGLPIPELRVVQAPAMLKAKFLEAAHSDYQPRSHQSVDVHHSGSIVHEQRPALRKPGEQPSASIEELRALARMSPEERRQRMGASPYPTDANGRRTIPKLSPPLNERPDDQGEIAKPNEPQPYTPQPQPPQPNEGKPSYAKPQKNLDHSGYGAGEPPPNGRFKVA